MPARHIPFTSTQRVVSRRALLSIGCAGLGAWSWSRFGASLATASNDAFGEGLGPEGSAAPSEGFEASFPAMGSLIELRIADAHTIAPETIVEHAQRVSDTWNDVLSDYQQDSICNRVCQEADGLDWVDVPDPLWRVLLECDRWHRATYGAFDASLGALTRVRRSKRTTTESAWQEARARCGWSHVNLDPQQRRLRFDRSGIRFDFGAIGKGFVVDRIGEQLRELGIQQFLINASGNMLCGDPPQGDSDPNRVLGWPVAIGTLGRPDRELHRVRLACTGIATSGDQHQRFQDDPSGSSPPTSHILDPEHRKGLAGPTMATVITPSASDADALATAICVLAHRGTFPTWLAETQPCLPPSEFFVQSWRDNNLHLTTVPCDW